MRNLSEILASDEISSLEQKVADLLEAGQDDAGWEVLQDLRKAQRSQREAAHAVLRIVDRQLFAREALTDIVTEIAQSHIDDVEVLAALGVCLEAVRDLDDLNAAPPDEPVFHIVVDRLTAAAEEAAGHGNEEAILRGLATSARMLARQRDDIAERSYLRLVEIAPQRSSAHYNLGLFYKTRGRFEDGLKANRAAARLADEVIESYEWNLGICATGAGHGEVALEVWKRMGQKIDMGRFGLPEGRYPQTKVKLAERPLAERTPEADDPGLEETIWIERLSPCHGVIRSVLYQDLGVDYGDVILIDGAPITYHTYGDDQVPVFPHLATLKRQDYQIFEFAGTQDDARRLAGASADLAGDSIIYSHSESFQQICANCWRDPDLDHQRHEATERHVVVGRIAAAADVDPAFLLGQIDAALAQREACQIYVPDLCTAAGDDSRASVERRRFDMLTGN